MALSVWNWIDHATRHAHVTVADIERLQPGEKVDILCFDRNFGDHVDNYIGGVLRKKLDLEKNVVVDVADFLARGSPYQFTYEHGAGLMGTAAWQGEWAKNEPPRQFEFDIEYKPDHYYPLKNGRLPRGKGWDTPLGFEGHAWTQFPKTSRVGWRGPCVFVRNLHLVPPTFAFGSDDENVVQIFKP